MIRLNFVFLSVLFFSFVTAAGAESNNVITQKPVGELLATGKILNDARLPATGAQLELNGPIGDLQILTDEDGNWHLYNLKPGKYTISAPEASTEVPSESFEFEVKEPRFFKFLDANSQALQAPDIVLSK